jgi:hypothetical protein
MTPSFPTFSIALAIKSPISHSPLAEIVATYYIIKYTKNKQTNKQTKLKQERA